MRDPNGERELVRAYREAGPRSFALFLGAGVNSNPAGEADERIKPRGSWPELLKALHREIGGGTQPFEELRREHRDWLDLATVVVHDEHDFRRLAERIDKLIYYGVPRRATKRKSKLLARRPILEDCTTLRAAICFATRLNDPAKTMSFCPNARIGAIFTTNYDFFFPAGWSRYQATFDMHWKQWTPPSRERSSAGAQTQSPGWDPADMACNRKGQPLRPIFHLHGYIPYERDKSPEGEWAVRARELILTSDDYRRAYGEYGFASSVLHDAARRYRLLFLGVSFDDPILLKALHAARGAGGGRTHFAVVGAQALKRLDGLNVTPLVVDDFALVPAILRRVYCEGLADELSRQEIRRRGITGDGYWERLDTALMTRGRRGTDRP